MLPDMSDVLEEFSQSITLKRTTQTVVNFRPVETTVDSIIQAVVQPANKEKINPAIIDWSLKYVLVHTAEIILNNDVILYNGLNYKAVEDGDYQDYGFTEALFEEIK
jgi:hypothetical protein